MKIRTDFVTNSSSESSVEVFIDNPVLLEILQKYKDLGLFIEDGERAYDFGIGYAFSWYAGYYFEDGVSGSLDAVLGSIIEVMGDERENQDRRIVYDDDLFSQMEKELWNREKEIMDGYISVEWGHRENSNEETGEDCHGYIDKKETFTYDRKKGEEWHFIKTNEEGVTLEESHSINGEKIQ